MTTPDPTAVVVPDDVRRRLIESGADNVALELAQGVTTRIGRSDWAQLTNLIHCAIIDGAAILASRATRQPQPAGSKLCAICGGSHDNDLLSDICTGCEAEAPWREPEPAGVEWPFEYDAPFTAHRYDDDTVSLTAADGRHVAWFNTHTQLPLNDEEGLEEEAAQNLRLVQSIADAMNVASGAALLSARQEQPVREEWRDIASAPRDGRTILIFRQNHVALGMWTTDDGNRVPRPYWFGTDAESWGRAWARKTQPTHWRPLPAPPAARERGR